MKLPDQTRGALFILLAQIVWGVAGPLVKIALLDIPPGSLLFLRSLVTTIILFPIYEFILLPKRPPITTQDKKFFFLAGFVGVFGNIALYFTGQRLTTVSDAWIITSSCTLIIIAVSYLFFNERLSKTVYLGVALAFLGTIVIIGTPLFRTGSGSFTGNLLMLAATIANVIFYFSSKKLVGKFSALTITFYLFLITVIASAPLFVWEFVQNPFWMVSVLPARWLIVIYLALGSSIVSYAFSNKGLKILSPSLASTIGYTSTVIAVGLGIVFLHDPLTKSFILGTALVIVGLFLAETRHPGHPLHKLRRK